MRITLIVSKKLSKRVVIAEKRLAIVSPTCRDKLHVAILHGVTLKYEIAASPAPFLFSKKVRGPRNDTYGNFLDSFQYCFIPISRRSAEKIVNLFCNRFSTMTEEERRVVTEKIILYYLFGECICK